MKILMVNKFFYIKGGSETYYFSLKKLLESKGHTVIDFSMQDEKNYNSSYARYFVSNVDYNKKGIGKIDQFKAAINIIYSFEAKKKFEQLILDTKPDIVHLHIFQHQLSPSILDVIKKYKIPAVYTAHDLKMLCLNYKMMHHNTVCEQCKEGKYFYCAKNKCVKDSLVKSSVNVVEGYFHKYRKSYNAIDKIITPSDFYRKKFIEFGTPSEKVIHIPNFLDTEKPIVTAQPDRETYYLYFGRLSEEKGVVTLLKAFKKLYAKLYIVGTGPLENQINQYVVSQKLRHVKMLGFKSGQELRDIVGNSKAVILPSEWYENGPYSAIEALQLGRPIIGANIGGIPELLVENGFLFESGNVEDLAEKVSKMEKITSDEYQKMKQASIRLFQRNYTAENHYRKIEKVYLDILDECRK